MRWNIGITAKDLGKPEIWRRKKKKNKILGAIENRKDEKKKKMKTKIKGAIENIEWMKNWNVWKLVEEK